MSERTVRVRSLTIFAENGELDEDGYRQFLQRFVDSRLGVYIGGGSACEGYTLSPDEFRRSYEIGVSVCKGRVFIGSNAAEVHTARDTIEQAKIAMGAGVDVVNIYGPAGWHGYRPNREEYLTFFDSVLAEVKYPVSIAPNPTALDYLPEASWVADICNKHAQVVSVNFGGIYDDTYLIELKDSFEREIETYITMPFVLSGFAIGATGLNAWESNILPKTYRSFLDHYDAGRMSEAGRIYTDIRRFEKFVHSNYHERWFKMALKVFKLPGGKGGFREPYLMPSDDVLEKFAASVIAFNLPEINELAKAAGLT